MNELSCPDRAIVEHAVAQGDPNVLRMALYQATRDPELAAMSVVHTRGHDVFPTYTVDKVHEAEIRRKAVDYLLGGGTDSDVPVPDDKSLRVMMALLTGEELTDAEFGLGREQLAFDDFPREATWSDTKPELPEGFNVAIIGAGASGIATAVQLERLGIPYVIYERQAEAGGTWHLNQYPASRLDTNSFIYQFMFVKNYPWREYFASQAEVKEYLEYVANTFGVSKNIVFDTLLERAEFDEGTGTWSLTLTDASGVSFSHTANVVVSGAGQFSTPRRPDIRGVEDFAGDFLLTTEWDQSFDPKGKTVAVIGNGSTGVQLMPHLAKHADQVYLFQRTPQWIKPAEDNRAEIPEGVRWLFDHMPYYWNWFCYHTHVSASAVQLAQEYDRDWQARGGKISALNDAVRDKLTDYIRDKLSDRPELIEKVLPDYAPLARRLILDSGWYDALLRDNVELITEGISHFTKDGIVTTSGREVAVDAVAFAGGFDVGKYLFPTEYIGRGTTMEHFWSADGPRAYLGLAVPSFPNLFMLYGPNGQARSGAFLTWIEIWSRYVAQAIVHLIESGHDVMEVRKDVFDDYQHDLDSALEGLIWLKEGPQVRNYFVRNGRQIVNWPWRNEKYFEKVAAPNPHDYELEKVSD